MFQLQFQHQNRLGLLENLNPLSPHMIFDYGMSVTLYSATNSGALIPPSAANSFTDSQETSAIQ